MIVNVFAQGNGWLFGDLKRRFGDLALDGVSVRVSDEALAGADAWVAVRTWEGASAPDPRRTLVCIHDCYDDEDLYGPEGSRGVVHRAGGLSLCHPAQRELLEAAGVDLAGKSILERPLGALTIFTPRKRQTEPFQIGWVGRNDWRKRTDWLPKAVLGLQLPRTSFGVVLVGTELEPLEEVFRDEDLDCRYYPRCSYPIEDYPAFYHRMDVLVITSMTEAGPLTLFEALACGVPVVATPVGWAPHFSRIAPDFVRIAHDPADIACHLARIAAERDLLFARRQEMADLVAEHRLDTWCPQVAGVGGLSGR